MPEPSLRELLQRIAERDKLLGQSLRGLLEAVGEMHAKDMATIESLRQHVANWETELAEAKAEIERLRQEYDIAKDEHEMYKKGARARTHSRREECYGWRKQAEEAERELASYTASVNTDAEIGRMVRNMRPHTALLKTETTYWGQIAKTRMEWSTAEQPWFETDPALALRAIQEKSDDEV